MTVKEIVLACIGVVAVGGVGSYLWLNQTDNLDRLPPSILIAERVAEWYSGSTYTDIDSPYVTEEVGSQLKTMLQTLQAQEGTVVQLQPYYDERMNFLDEINPITEQMEALGETKLNLTTDDLDEAVEPSKDFIEEVIDSPFIVQDKEGNPIVYTSDLTFENEVAYVVYKGQVLRIEEKDVALSYAQMIQLPEYRFSVKQAAAFEENKQPYVDVLVEGKGDRPKRKIIRIEWKKDRIINVEVRG